VPLGTTEPLSRAEVARHFVTAGFAVVYQDCRGRYGSEGKFVKYLAEGEDGFDTMAWLVEQDWCNGRIGTMGLSYAAHTQMALACLNAPGLAAMVIDSGGFASAFRCGIRQGGAFELKQATWAYNNARESREAREDPALLKALDAEDLRTWFKAMPWRSGVSPVRWIPEYEDYLLDQWRSGTFDESWRQVGLYAEGYYPTFPDVPVMLMSSWYDAYVSSTLDNYAGLSDGRRVLPRLVIGAGLHGNRNHTFAGDASFGRAASFDGHVAENWLAFRRRWFERWLKGGANGVDAEPRVSVFLMGGGTGARTAEGRIDHGGSWIEAADWPLPGTKTRAYNLHPTGLLSEDEPPADAAPFTYDFDPANPVPTIGGALTSGQPVFEGGAFDQRESLRFFGCTRPGLPLSARHDVLAFETPPLAEAVVAVGPIVFEFWVSSDAPDTDFTAKLIDVHPPSADYPTGNALNLTDGILRCRYRKSFERPEPITAGEIFPIRIECFATANLFEKGHRIRVEISSSNFPKFDVNPNTGAPEGQGLTKRIARNSVYCDAAHPSRLLLPVVPRDSLAPLGRVGR
jgi:putative CocE/NonD family hydrolase